MTLYRKVRMRRRKASCGFVRASATVRKSREEVNTEVDSGRRDENEDSFRMV
jgi:hypothetical protein